MVQSLPGFLNLCLNVCSPSQVIGDVYTEVLEATHPLHRGPTDHKRSVGPLLSLPEVHNQLFSFTLIQRESCPGTMMLWRFSTAWYGTVRHGTVRCGTAQFGSVCVSTAV